MRERKLTRREVVEQRLHTLRRDWDPDGEEARALRNEREALDREVEEIDGSLSSLRDSTQKADADLERAEIEEMFAGARKKAGGAFGEHGRRIEAAEEHERKAAEAREKADGLASLSPGTSGTPWRPWRWSRDSTRAP